MDAILALGRVIVETAERTRDHDGLGCAKLVDLRQCRRTTTRSWPAPSTAAGRAGMRRSTSGSAVPAWSRPRWRTDRARADNHLARWPK